MFDDLLGPRHSDTKPTAKDEVVQYLKSRTEIIDDPIKWWLAQRSTYPRLSRMAIDYLMIPGVCLSRLQD
jgi:hAT family C-terminal dimerisation region